MISARLKNIIEDVGRLQGARIEFKNQLEVYYEPIIEYPLAAVEELVDTEFLDMESDQKFIQSMRQWLMKNRKEFSIYSEWLRGLNQELYCLMDEFNEDKFEEEKPDLLESGDEFYEGELDAEQIFRTADIEFNIPGTNTKLQAEVPVYFITFGDGNDEDEYHRQYEEAMSHGLWYWDKPNSPDGGYEPSAVVSDVRYDDDWRAELEEAIEKKLKEAGWAKHSIASMTDFCAMYEIFGRIYTKIKAVSREAANKKVEQAATTSYNSGIERRQDSDSIKRMVEVTGMIGALLRKTPGDVREKVVNMQEVCKWAKCSKDTVYDYIRRIRENPKVMEWYSLDGDFTKWIIYRTRCGKKLFRNVNAD